MNSFFDRFVFICNMNHDIPLMTGPHSLPETTTDSLYLFSILTKEKCNTENGLMIALEIVQNSYSKIKIKNITGFSSSYNAANILREYSNKAY